MRLIVKRMLKACQELLSNTGLDELLVIEDMQKKIKQEAEDFKETALKLYM